MTAIELGAGLGLLSMTLHSLGCDVLATDTGRICELITRPNLAANSALFSSWTPSSSRRCEAKVLDWIQFARYMPTEVAAYFQDWPDFDLIVTSDTVYQPTLFAPLLSTLRSICLRQVKTPTILLGLEKRDPLSVQQFWQVAGSFGFRSKQIKPSLLKELMAGHQWADDDWDGVEIHEVLFKRRSGD